MRLGVRLVVVMLSVGVGLVTPVTPTAAGSVESARREAARVQDELDSLADEAARLADDYEGAQAELIDLQRDVAALEARITKMRGEVDVLQSAIGELALSTFISGDQQGGLATLLLGEGSVNDIAERAVYANLTGDTGAQSVDSLDAAAHDLALAQAEKERKQTKVTRKLEHVAAARSLVEQRTAEYERLRSDAQARLGQALEDERRRREAEAERAAAASKPPAPRATQPRRSATSGTQPTSGGGSTPAAAEPAAPAPDEPPAPQPRRGSNVPAPSAGASGAVAAAMSQLGVPYKYATAEPGVNFDCSGLTMWAWGQAGVSLPHYSKSQFEMLPHVPADQAQPGDLIFYKNPVGHVAIYIGGGQLIHAPRTGDVVKVSTVNWSKVRDGVVGRPG